MRRALLILTVVLAACSPTETAATSTIAPQASTTNAGQSGPTTSPAPDTTTSTVAETTTTSTTTTSTTTTTTPPGNWADEPVVAAGFGALGWWDGASWVQVDEFTALPVLGGEDYQIALLGLQAITTAGPQTIVCEPLENVGVLIDHEELLGDWPGPVGVAISAPWDLTPHLVEEVPDDGTYAAFASELLASRGLVVANPVIKQVLRVDLEGDGVNEVIIVAEEGEPVGFFQAEGDYSIAFLRKIVQGEVQTAVLGESLILDPEVDFFYALTVGAVADLNGDGKMEIVLDAAYYEGLGVEVWEYVNDDLGPQIVLQQGCGV